MLGKMIHVLGKFSTLVFVPNYGKMFHILPGKVVHFVTIVFQLLEKCVSRSGNVLHTMERWKGASLGGIKI